MTIDLSEIRKALKTHGSIRGAAKSLHISHTALQWQIAHNGYRVERRAVLVKSKSERSA